MTAHLLNMAYEMQKMKLGLDHLARIHQQIGAPADQWDSIHVGGTNGKGSVSTKIAAALQEQGKKVGLYTSPHLVDIRERIQINGQMIEDLDRWIEPLLSYDLTYFETLTLGAFLAFAEAQVDVAVIEVGLGGRLDATNIINPQLAVITSIGWDHMHYLGSTLEEIAKEKAGIIKSGIPVVIGPQAQPYHVFQEKTDNLTIVHGTFLDFEKENQAIAKEALKKVGIIPSEAALQQVPLCRFERHHNIIFDVAHNPCGLKALFRRLAKLDSPLRVVAAFSADKSIHEMTEIIYSYTPNVHLTQAEHPRAHNFGAKNIRDTLEEAYALACEHNEILVICGTVFMMATARQVMKKYLVSSAN